MQVKGTAVLTIPLFIKARFGDDGHRQWLAALTEAARGVYSGNVLASNWYPLGPVLVEPTKCLCDLFYRGQIAGAVDQGRFSADHGLKGIYKVFVKLGSVDSLVARASTILPTYYEPSAMEVVDKGFKTVRLRITKFETPHAIVEHRIKGWMERAVEISGVQSPQVRIACSMAGGQPHTDYVVTWS